MQILRARSSRAVVAALAAVAVFGSVACSEARVQAAPAAVSKLALTTVTARPSSGKAHRYRVEIAATEAEQARGLMFRKTMPRDAGMIFPMKPPRFASFWMENTYLPLDIIFIAADGKVLNIVHGEPKSRTPLYSVGPAAAVLELNAGECERIGLEPGDAIDGAV